MKAVRITLIQEASSKGWKLTLNYHIILLIMSTNSGGKPPVLEEDSRKKVLCFEPDFTRFNLFCMAYYNHMKSTADDIWDSFHTYEDFRSYITVFMRAYSHLTLKDQYRDAGVRSESPTKITQTIGASMKLPVFIIDMIREIFRPMYCHSGILLVAYLPLEGKGYGPVNGLGLNATMRSVMDCLKKPVINVDLGLCVEERLSHAPFYVATDKMMVYVDGSTPDKSRMHSMRYLRHVTPKVKTIYLGYTNLSYDANPGNQAFPSRKSFKYQALPLSNPVDTTEGDCTNRRVFDAVGREIPMQQVVRSDIETINYDPQVITDRNSGERIGIRDPVPIPEMVFGYFPRHEFYSILKAINVVDSNLTMENCRQYFPWGTAFSAELYYDFPPFEGRFPNSEHPSTATQATANSGQPGKRRRGKKKKKNNRTQNGASESSSTQNAANESPQDTDGAQAPADPE